MSRHSPHSLSSAASRWLSSAPRLPWPLASPTTSQQRGSPCSAHHVPPHSSSGQNHSLAKSLLCCSCRRPHGQPSSLTPNSPQHSVGGAHSATRSWSNKPGSQAARAWSCRSTTKRARPPSGRSSPPAQWCSNNDYVAPNVRYWPSATASLLVHCRSPKTTSVSAKATPAPTPAAWVRSLRPQCHTTSTNSQRSSSSPSSTTCAPTARRSSACSTPA
ncbi:unannotated protein [freshwater metagenome]|uniref:Unannotated protein n=1 Tax=freshwater metagenome TaxID=449393 RepID=A0A6J6YHZ5_9ZZZZ